MGRRRPHNEDSYLCDDDLGLYIVADGVGGNAKGEVASAESVDLVHSWVRRWRATLESHRATPTDESTGLVRRLLESAVQSACYMVFGMGQLDPRQKGMSSTLSSLLVSAKGGKTIAPGQTVNLQVQNPDGSVSNTLTFTRPQ